MNVNLHFHIANAHVHVVDEGKGKEILEAINSLNLKSTKMGQELDTLVQEVSETKTVMQSALTLIKGFKQRLDDAIAAGNPQKLQELSNELDTSTNELAAAVAENTPSEGGENGGEGNGEVTPP